MHYFKKNIGDYYKKAGRLNMLQHGAYSLLIDACYDREKFPTIDEAIDWAWASTTEEIDAVKFVLSRFFTIDGGVYRQSRIAEEIAEYQEFRVLQSQKGKKGGRPKKADGFNKKAVGFLNKADGKPVESHCKADESLTTNQEPLTINQKEKKEKKESYPQDFETAWKAYPKREGGNPKNSAFKAWNARMRDGVTPEDMTDGIARYTRYLKAKDMIGTQWVKQASAFFGPDKHYAEQWEVAPPKPKRNGSGTAEDVGRAYEAEFGKPAPRGASTDEVRAMISQRRDKQAQWYS